MIPELFYILDKDHNPVPATLTEWATWISTHPRHVADDHFGPTRVSTIFLGVDHRRFGGSHPILSETIIFRDGKSDELLRYCTWNEAVKSHQALCFLIQAQPESKKEPL